MTPSDFTFLCDYLKRTSGLVLSDDKQYLIDSRLLPIARDAGLDSLPALVDALRRGGNRSLEKQVIEAMTTNESFFFRNKTPFQQFTDIMLPELMAARASSKKIRIWCAAASTGQEPYSIAMCLKELGSKVAGWRFEIIGTDLSTEVLEKAKTGIYSQFEVQRGLPIEMLLKYFDQVGDTWQIKSEIRSMVQYRPANLLESFSAMGQFDVVFCRNVLIYFDRETKSDILDRIAKQMPEDGYLTLGSAETVVGLSKAFVSHSGQHGLYARVGSGAEQKATGTLGRVSGMSRTDAVSTRTTPGASHAARAGATGGLSSSRTGLAGTRTSGLSGGTAAPRTTGLERAASARTPSSTASSSVRVGTNGAKQAAASASARSGLAKPGLSTAGQLPTRSASSPRDTDGSSLAGARQSTAHDRASRDTSSSSSSSRAGSQTAGTGRAPTNAHGIAEKPRMGVSSLRGNAPSAGVRPRARTTRVSFRDDRS